MTWKTRKVKLIDGIGQLHGTWGQCVHILFLLPVLFLMLLQEDMFLLLDLRPKLLLRRKKQLILAREYGIVVLRQGETHRRVVLLCAEQYAYGGILVRLLLVAVVVVDVELKLTEILVRQLVIFYLYHHERAQQTIIEHKVGEILVVLH